VPLAAGRLNGAIADGRRVAARRSMNCRRTPAPRPLDSPASAVLTP
jgi:hypothetical protein